MYFDTINISFLSTSHDENFNYHFTISKNESKGSNEIIYGDLLKKFVNIGFKINYLEFPNTKLNETVYCNYNYTMDFNIFFRAYNKLLVNKEVNILFECGNLINGVFTLNNINSSAKKYFSVVRNKDLNESGIIINGKTHKKVVEIYQIIDKDGHIISLDKQTEVTGFNNDFFKRKEVLVILRKSKLDILKNKTH